MEEKIRTFIKRNIMSERDKILENSDNIFEKGIVNSLFSMHLITYLEKEFSIVVSYEDMNLENFSSVDNICSYIRNKEAHND